MYAWPVQPEPATPAAGSAARTGLVGALVAGYAFFDVIPIAIVVIALTAWLERPLIVFVITAVGLLVLNIACCNWLQRHWESWIAGNGQRIDERLQKLRDSRLMRHPVAWITRGSDWWYALATAIINPIIVVALAHVIGGERVGDRRVLIASAAYAIPMAVVFTATGYALGLGVRAG